MPESQSTETILDDDETTDQQHKKTTKATATAKQASSPPKASTSSRPNSASMNGIDNGITLNPASLNANINLTINPASDTYNLKSGSSSRKTVPSYIEVDSKKKSELRKDEEIRC
jgi:hypothetical protein